MLGGHKDKIWREYFTYLNSCSDLIVVEMLAKACILLAFFCCLVRSERGRKVIKTRDLESGGNVELIEIDAQANDL